jgi:hypothetical protein
MTANDIPTNQWQHFKKTEFPSGVLDHMDARLLTECLFPLRQVSGVSMMPSSLYGAHVRHTDGRSLHCTHNKTRLSQATDFHVATHDKMMRVVNQAQTLDSIGGIGIYFDTHRPMIHIDMRSERLMWLRYAKNGRGVYLYRENGYIEFYKKLGELLCQ